MAHWVLGPLFGLESLYYLAIAAICFLIYFKTRDILKLSSHEGIKYFRYTFLFFGLSSLIRFLIREYAVTFFMQGPGRTLLNIELASALLIIYTHMLAALFLVYSICWKNLGRLKNRPWALYFIALIPIALTAMTGQSAVYLVSQVFLIAYGIGVIHSKPHKKKSQMHIIYDLLLLFWMLNILDTIVPNFLVAWQLAIYAASLWLFLMIFGKVHKCLGVKK